MKKYKKNLMCVIIIIICLILSGCGISGDSSIVEDIDIKSYKDFFEDNSSITIYYFDIDNLSENDVIERTYQSDSTNNVGSCESYIIKSGNIEILVDAGYQTFNSSFSIKEEYPYTFSHQYLKQNVQKNIMRKVASVCTDGVLEYLVVTHSDFDHIASLCVDGGIFDSFYNEEIITNLRGQDIKLKSINNIIDFNSGVLSLHSYEKIYKDQRLCRALYQTYLVKIDKLINKNNNSSNYLPAASLFSEKIVANDGTTMSLKNKLLATPDKMKEHVEKYFQSRILTENQPNDAASQYVNDIKKNSDYKDSVERLGGELISESERYYYKINLNSNVEFRILYNWYYDFAYRQSFDDGNRGQPINNPSVCFEVVSGKFKFLSCGDIGGNGENGLINYYENTSILKSVTLYKASHHGSTTNEENSERIFNTITPKIIVVTGCAQSPLDVKNTTAAYMKQKFFDNIYNGLHDAQGVLNNNLLEEPYILCTNINWFRINESNNIPLNESKPFYGDIKISYSKGKTYISYSYRGIIHALVHTGSQEDVVDFRTVKEGKIVKIQDTEWFRKVGFKYGEIENGGDN